LKLNVIYEDNHVIVVYKEAGVLSQPDNTNDDDLYTMIKKYLKEKYNKPGEAFLGIVHRLDRMTSGVMVYAKTSKAAKRLSEDIKAHRFIKEYLAVVDGTLESYSETKLVNYMTKNEELNKSYIDPNGKEAVLYYRTMKIKNSKSLINVRLETGRHHQIRLQMSTIGHPLYGDIKYGSKYQDDLALQAYKLSFYQPVTQELLVFEEINYKGIFNIFK